MLELNSMTKIENMQSVIDSNASDYQDAGITSTVAVAGHPLHPLLGVVAEIGVAEG